MSFNQLFNTAAEQPQLQNAIPQQLTPVVEEIKYPHEVYNYIINKCFDACKLYIVVQSYMHSIYLSQFIYNFDNKSLDSTENTCVEDCVYHIREGPHSFQKAHRFQGFLPSHELKPQAQPFGGY